MAVVGGGGIYTSTNSGLTWALRTSDVPATSWNFVASSSDGTKLAAAFLGDQIYTSIPTPVPSTTLVAGGGISGGQYDAIELQYIGNDIFDVLSHEGYLVVQ